MTDKIDVLVFAEEMFEERYSFETKSEAAAFADGVMVGSSLYGAGSCIGYVMPDDEEEMKENEEPEEVERAHAAQKEVRDVE